MSQIKAQGTVIKIGDNGTPVAYTTIRGIKDFSVAQESREALDTTDLCSTSKEKISGIRDGGEATFSGNLDFDDSGADAVRAAFAAGTAHDWTVDVTDENSATTTISFNGFVSSLALASGSVDAIVEDSFTVTVTGISTTA